MTTDEYFYSLIKPKRDKRMVKCLRCRKPFMSLGPHQRTCATCQDVNRKRGALADPNFIASDVSFRA